MPQAERSTRHHRPADLVSGAYGEVSIESAALSLDTSVRTLQRELNREGTDFRTIDNAMRSRRALELLLHTNASITRISMFLGYSAPAHFARAFRSHGHELAGVSPEDPPVTTAQAPLLEWSRVRLPGSCSIKHSGGITSKIRQ